MKEFLVNGVAVLALALGAASANATIVTVFDDFAGGVASFNSTVSSAGGTANAVTLGSFSSGIAPDFGDFTITRNNGGTIFDNGVYTLYNSSPSTTTSGHTIDISPDGTFPLSNGTIAGGVSFNFDAPVNALGFEVGDWATCCQPSNLYISFDDGTPILVGASTVYGDQFLTNGGAGVFVAALDDSGSFSKVSFWGDGSGEYLVIGGTVRYALLEEGSLPPSAIPEPEAWLLMIAGFGLVGAALRRRNAMDQAIA